MPDRDPDHRIPGVTGTEQGDPPAHDPTCSVNSPKNDPGHASLRPEPREDRKHIEDELDEAGEESFPASDPVSVKRIT